MLEYESVDTVYDGFTTQLTKDKGMSYKLIYLITYKSNDGQNYLTLVNIAGYYPANLKIEDVSKKLYGYVKGLLVWVKSF